MTKKDHPQPVSAPVTGTVKLDLGCGKNKHGNCIGIDWSKENSDADIISDLNRGIPFPDSSADEIYASHILEHIDDLTGILKEIHRVCRNGATVHIWVPFCMNLTAFTDPEHKHFFGPGTLDFFCWNRKTAGRGPKLFNIKKAEWEICYTKWTGRVVKNLVRFTGGVRSPFNQYIDGLYYELEVVK